MTEKIAWPLAWSLRFLENNQRIFLWELDLICERYGITPSEYMGLTETVNDANCFVFDATVARFGRWVEGRLKETTGGKRPQPKYPTLGEALGMQDDDIMSLESQEMGDAGDAYMKALVHWQEFGGEYPDPAKFVPDMGSMF